MQSEMLEIISPPRSYVHSSIRQIVALALEQPTRLAFQLGRMAFSTLRTVGDQCCRRVRVEQAVLEMCWHSHHF